MKRQTAAPSRAYYLLTAGLREVATCGRGCSGVHE
jgi:hypothetical protein